jgi:hypothetical protein
LEQKQDYEEKCTRYLLDELSEDEQTQFEESYFADDSLFERFLVVKDDLVDSYARGDLRGAERERFEQHFLLSQPRHRQVTNAKEFIRAVTSVSLNEATEEALPDAPTPEKSWWQSISTRVGLPPLVLQGALAAVLLAALGGSWLLIKNFQSLQAERARLQNEEAARGKQGDKSEQPSDAASNENRTEVAAVETTSPIGNKPPANSATPPQPETTNKQPTQKLRTQVASLTLLPFAARDGGSSTSLLLSQGTRAVRLGLVFKGDDFIRYDVALRTLEGEQVMHRRAFKAASSSSGKSLTVTLDPALLRRQDYIVTLSGLTKDGQSEAIAEYYFRVERTASRSAPAPPINNPSNPFKPH